MTRPKTGAHRQAFAFIAAAVVVGGSIARAEAPALSEDDLPMAPTNDDETRVLEAQARFRLGVRLYAQGDPIGALAKLRDAYALAPSYRMLFNLGEVAYQCHDYAAALGYLSRYLDEGGTQIPEARRRQVARDIGALRARVGYLSIEHPDPGLRVKVDELDLGTTPLVGPVAANAGRRRIEISAPTGERQTRTVDIVPEVTLTIPFTTLAGKTSPTPPALQAPAPPATVPKAPVLTPSMSPGPPSSPVLLAQDGAKPAREHPGRVAPWVSWTLAAVAAGGAAVTGGLAWSASRSLQEKASSYPASAPELRATYDRERRYALASDGLLAGAAVLSALALYVTLRGTPASDEGRPGHLEARADW